MRRNARVTLLCYDPRRPLRYLEIRGTVVEMTEDGAGRHLDEIASKYIGRPRAVLRRRDPDAVRRDRDPGPVPDPADPRRRARCRGPEAAAMTAGAITGHGVAGDPTPADVPIPASHLDLLTRPICAVLTTMGTDGQPQSSLVWVDHDGECARVNTTLERQKGRNLLACRRVSLLVVDPENTARFLQVRGDVELDHGRGGRPRRRADPEVHAASRVLRLDLSGRAAGPRDPGDLPDPRATGHARRDPRLTRPAPAEPDRSTRRLAVGDQPHEVRRAEDADRNIALVHHDETMDLLLVHDPGGLDERRREAHGQGR